jgi:outer membrane lipopolysaccharide assembly protein LptE/RlpB
MTPIVRLSEDLERQIADKAEKAVALRAEADQLENEMAEKATELVDRYLSGKPI